MVWTGSGSATVKCIRRLLPLLLLIFLAFGVTACALKPEQPTDFSLSSPTVGASQSLVDTAANEPAVDTDQDDAEVLSLPQAWRLALQYNQSYQADLSDKQAAHTLHAQGLAQLLPQIEAGASYSYMTGHRRQPAAQGPKVKNSVRYNSKAAYVQIQQPLLDFERFGSYRWQNARADQGEADWRVAQNELAQKLIEGWVDVSRARALQAVHQDLVDSLERQVKAQKALYEQGEAPITDVQQTQSRLASQRAELIQDKTDLKVARRNLQAIIGSPRKLKGLTDDRAALTLMPGQLQKWQRQAQNSNAQVIAHQAAQKTAGAKVQRDIGASLPSLDLTASWSKADSEDLSTLNQRSNTYAVGVELTVPIFAGGRNSAQVSQSRSQERQARQEAEAASQEAKTQVTQNFNDARRAGERIRSLRDSIKSRKETVYATKKGYEYGEKANRDILKAKDKLAQTREDLVNTRMDRLQSYVELRLAAGDNMNSTFQQTDLHFFSDAREHKSGHHQGGGSSQSGSRAGKASSELELPTVLDGKI